MIIPDEFDKAAAEVAGANTPKTPMDEAAAAVVGGQRTALRSSLYNSLMENPDMAARATQLGRQTGLPTDVVQRNLPQVQRDVQLNEFDQVLKDSPTVAKWLTDQNNAKIAHDDVPNLSALDKALQFARDTGGAAKAGLLYASGGVVNVPRAPLEMLAPLLDPLAGTILPENPLRRVIGGLDTYQSRINEAADAAMPKADGILGSGYYSGIASLSRNAAALPLLFLPGGQKAALTGMVAPVAGQEYGEAREKGLEVVPSLTYAASQAAIEYATEKLPISRLLGDVKAGETFAKILGRQALLEIPGEQVATVLQDLNEFAVLQPDATFGDYLRERPSAAAQTLVATIVGTGGQVSIVKGVDTVMNRFTERENLALDAEQNAAAFEQINQLATASRVMQRDVATFEAFVAQATAEAPIQDVFVDARIFAQVVQEAGLSMEQLSPSVQEQFTDAINTGGDLRIPVAEYTAQIATTDYAQGLLDHLKTNAQGMSRAEAQVFMQSQGEALQAEVERVLTEKAKDDTFKASTQGVKTHFAEKLAAVGRFTPDVNNAYATMLGNFYAVTAARAGVTPEQLLDQYPLEVQAEGVTASAQQYDQAGVYDKGDVEITNQTDEITGLPLNSDGTVTLYHHTSAERAEAIKSSGALRSAGEPDVYLTTRDVPDTGYGESVVKVRIKPEKLQIDDEFGDGRVDYRVSVGRPGGSLTDAKFNQGTGYRGQVSFGDDMTKEASVITLFKDADLSTFLHESGHFFLEVQFDLSMKIQQQMDVFGRETNQQGENEILKDTRVLLDWFGVESMEEWYTMPFERKREYHERFARGFEAYAFEGKAPNLELQSIFQRFRAWMLNLYRDMSVLDVELTPEVRGVMDRMIATTEQIELAEAGRSMMPLFASAEQAGMSTSEYADYLALNNEATQGAIENLQARSLRDMAWIANARGREIKKLQKQAEARRAEMTIEARREIMSQPVYRAWQFLTGKATRGAESRTRVIDPKAETPLELIGVDGIPVADGGVLFKTAESAKEAKMLRPDTRVIKAEGGYALVEKTEAQLAAEAKAAKRLALGTTGTKGMPEAAHQFLASKGGLKPSVRSELSVDGNVRVGSRWLFAAPGKGLSIEQAAMMLKEEGFTKTEDHNTALELIRKSLVTPQYTDEGWDRIAEIEREANTADEMPGIGLDIEVTNYGKFDLSALKGMGISPQVVQIIQDLKMTATDGIHPDVVADSFEFPSGEELVRSLAIAQSPKDAIEALTDKKMLESYGELATPEAIEMAADIAIHNDARARFVAAEFNAVNKAAGKSKVLTSAAKEYARKMVDRLQIRNIKPHQYAAAEARAAKAAIDAMKAGDTEQAATEKRNQLINTYATKAAYDAKDEIAKIQKLFKSVTRGGNKKLVERGRDPDVANAARAILAAYGVAPRLEKNALDYMDTLERNDPAMFAVVRPSVDAALANAKPLEELTLEELRGLSDEIESMWHLSKRSRQMEVDGNLLDIEEAGDQLNRRMEAIGIPDTLPGETSAITPREKAIRKLQSGVALLRRVEQWAIAKDGKWGGAFTSLVFQPVKQAADKYRTERTKARKQFTELVKTIAPTMKKGVIEAPELGYTFGKDETGVGMAELLHAIIHTGNESNKRKLLLGRGWAYEMPDGTLDTSRWDAFVERLQDGGVLTKAHYDFAQGVWDLLESTKPAAQKAHRDVYGRYFDEVTATPFVTPFGTYRGGYAPAQVDGELVTDAALRKLAEQENENMAYSFPSAPSGFTKARVEYNRPLKLDLRSLTQHLDKVLLFTYMQPAINDVNRLLSRKSVSQNLSSIDPVAYEGMLIPWLNRSARQVVETPVPGDGGFSRLLSLARNRAGMSLMFANLSNTFQQVTGFASAAAVVPKADLMRAVAQYVAAPKKMANDVAEASPYMRDRMQNEIAAITNVMDEILIDPTLYQKSQAWTQKHAYFMQAAVDNVMSPIVWTAAYNEGIKNGMEPSEAAKYGDSIVRQTQTTTLPEDVSRIETGPAYARLFTQFLNYFNTIANTNGTALLNIQSELGFRKGAGKALGVVFFGVLIPAMVAEAIAIAFRGGPEDEDQDGWYLDDWIAQAAGMGTLKFTLAGVPFVGQFVVAGINRFNSSPVDDKVSLSPAISLLESTVGAPYSVYKAMVDDGSVRRAVMDVSTAVAMITGLPTRAIARPLGYLAGVANDEIEPTGPMDVARGLLTGLPSPESKQ